MGNSKIIPNLDVDKFESIVLNSKAYADDQAVIDSLWSKCRNAIFLLSERTKNFGLAELGITTYFSDNCTNEDSELVNAWMSSKKVEGSICRTFKSVINDKTVYEIKLASIENGDKPGITYADEEYEGCTFKVTRGDYSKILRLLTSNLEIAKTYASNENQIEMINHNIRGFTEGCLDDLKNGSRYWIKDKGPIVENFMGFLFTYRDPAGVRAEFCGFVSMVNKPMSSKFNSLVLNAEQFISMLPWGNDFEKDTYLQPDFTSLDVLSFTGSTVPAGMCLPRCN